MVIKIVLFSLALGGFFGALFAAEAAEELPVENNADGNNNGDAGGNNNDNNAENSAPSPENAEKQSDGKDTNKGKSEVAEVKKKSLIRRIIGFAFRRAASSLRPTVTGVNVLLIPVLAFLRGLLLVFRMFVSIARPIERSVGGSVLDGIGMGRMAHGIECALAVINQTLLGLSCAMSQMTYFGSILSTCDAYRHTMEHNVCIVGLD